MIDHATLLKAVQAGERLAVDLNEPIPGWYRGSAKKGDPLVPIVIWCVQGDFGPECEALLGGQRVAVDRVWPFAARTPVSKEWHEHYARNGSWPDEHKDAPAIGHNNPPTEPIEALREQIEAAAAGVTQYATIADATMAGAAQSLRSRLTALSQEAYRHLRADKEPHEKAAKAVDDKWRPLVDKAKGGADAIRKMLSDWETGMLRQAEAAANALAEDGNIAEAAVLLATAPMAPTKIKGGAGRAASAKTVTVVDTVTDWPALILSMQNNTDLRELVLALANKALKAGATVPGVSTKQVREVR